MKIAFFPNLSKSSAGEITVAAGAVAVRCGMTPVIPDDCGIMPEGFELCPREDVFRECDVAVAVGGDGTIIHTAKRAALFGKPTLGINAGRIGYLAGLESNELERLSELKSGSFEISRRMMLEVNVGGRSFNCLNDAVVARGALSRMADIAVDIDGGEIKRRADGIIVATPTGSTAYSMSAGGPVLDPVINGIVLSYICPQSPSSRSIVLGGDTVIKIKANAAPDAEMFLTVDGEEAYRLSEGDAVTVRRDAKNSVRLISLKNESFYEVLSKKIG